MITDPELALKHIEEYGMFSPTVFGKIHKMTFACASDSLTELSKIYSVSKKKVTVTGKTYVVSFVTKPTNKQVETYKGIILELTKPTHSQLSPEINDAFKRAWV